MSEYDSEHDASHVQEGQEPVLSRVDYGDHASPETDQTPDQPEPSLEPEVARDPAPALEASRPRRRLKRLSFAKLAGVKRETRVGVAAVLSFVVLVGVFIANRPARSKTPAAKEGAASGSALSIPLPKETEAEEKFSPVKKPPEPLLVKSPEPAPGDEEPILPPTRPKDHDPNAIVLASNDKPAGDKPPEEKPPVSSEPTPPASTEPMPTLPTPKPEAEPPPAATPMPVAPPASAALEPPKVESNPTPTPPSPEPQAKPDLVPTPTPEIPKSAAASKPEEAPKPTEPAPPPSTAPAAPAANESPKSTEPILPPPASTQAPAPPPETKPTSEPALPDLPKTTEPAAPPPVAPVTAPAQAPLPVITPEQDPKPAPAANDTPPPTTLAPPASQPETPAVVSPMPKPVEVPPTLVPVPTTPNPATPEVKQVGEPAGLPPLGGDNSAPPPVPAVDESPAKPDPAAMPTLPAMPAATEVKPEPVPVEQPKASPVSTPEVPADVPTDRGKQADMPPAQPEPSATIVSSPAASPDPVPMPIPTPVVTKPLGPGWTKLRNLGKLKSTENVDVVDKPAIKEQAIPDAPPPREEFQATEEVEPVLHTVQRGENFWTISRLYYGSGRYYQALWSFNRRDVPNIRELYVGTTVKVPPPERLDRSLVEGPSAPSARPSLTSGESGNAPSRVTRPSNGSSQDMKTIPLRRTRSGVDPDLSLGKPVSRTSSEDVDAPIRPTYRVRPYDTLRGIAKQTLGDARREGEILELNRNVITDPRRLTTGQTLTLPEDATTPTRVR